jgi:hypothetical protein
MEKNFIYSFFKWMCELLASMCVVSLYAHLFWIQNQDYFSNIHISGHDFKKAFVEVSPESICGYYFEQ